MVGGINILENTLIYASIRYFSFQQRTMRGSESEGHGGIGKHGGRSYFVFVAAELVGTPVRKEVRGDREEETNSCII